MVDNPADLVQPRGQTSAYVMRRNTVIEKYRQGRNSDSADSTNSASSKISDVGK
jgi:pilus assembly protein CpaD